jgi:hypothetical protein
VWGGDADHDHEWTRVDEFHNHGDSTAGAKQKTNNGAVIDRGQVHYAFCPCGAWLGSLGLEPTPDLFLSHLVECFRAVWRVLRDDGCMFVNMGDSYAGSGNGSNDHRDNGASLSKNDRKYSGQRPGRSLPAKNLLMMPSRLAMALQQDGWILRSMIPWLKRNSMPESVSDRPSTAVEYWFLFSKQARYFWDADAVRTSVSGGAHSPGGGYDRAVKGSPTDKRDGQPAFAVLDTTGRNRRNSDWFWESWQGLMLDEDDAPMALVVNPAGFSGARLSGHYGGSSDSRRKVSPDCPVHGQPRATHITRTGEDDEPQGRASLDIRNRDMSNYPAPVLAGEPDFATQLRENQGLPGATRCASSQSHTPSCRSAGLFDEAELQTDDGTAHTRDQSVAKRGDQQVAAQGDPYSASHEETGIDTVLNKACGSSPDEARPRRNRGTGHIPETPDSTSLGSETLSCEPTATAHSNGSHRTGRVPLTSRPCTPSAQTPDDTQRTAELPDSSGSADRICESNIAEASSSGVPQSDLSEKTPSHTERSCTCQIIDHFATFPVALVEPMIKASTSEKGQCPECGAPWMRLTERESKQDQKSWSGAGRANGCLAGGGHFGRTGQFSVDIQSIGWQPSCAHTGEPVPQTVLDPFSGAGTTLMVADRLGRNAIGCELSSAYSDLGTDRLVGDAPMFVQLESA